MAESMDLYIKVTREKPKGMGSGKMRNVGTIVAKRHRLGKTVELFRYPIAISDKDTDVRKTVEYALPSGGIKVEELIYDFVIGSGAAGVTVEYQLTIEDEAIKPVAQQSTPPVGEVPNKVPVPVSGALKEINRIGDIVRPRAVEDVT